MKVAVDLECLVETHDRPFLVIDREYRIVSVNQAFERMYHLRREDVLGRTCFEVSHHSDRPCHEQGEDCPYAQVYRTGQLHTCVHTHYDTEGQPHAVRVSVSPLRSPDGTLYLGELAQELGARPDMPAEERHNPRPVGQGAAFLHTMEQLDLAAKADAPVLLLGETGTGKELAATFIHRHSERRDQPFLALDCTVLTEPLFESEVFGHERGAFTSSVAAKKGLFELADRGTLFLDEISEMPLSMQAKLLRVLENGEFRRVGGNSMLRADVRIVCATNRHLWERVKAGQFREDLYYRVACFCIHLPPLRERVEDIPLLAENLLARLDNGRGGPHRLGPDAVRRLQSYDYPGNIRELRNLLRVAAAHCKDGTITEREIERWLRGKHGSRADDGAAGPPGRHPQVSTAAAPVEVEGTRPVNGDGDTRVSEASGRPPLATVEARHIAELLRRYGGHRRSVADALGISERTLYRKLQRYGLR
jgi:two-component system response regulator AtoC